MFARKSSSHNLLFRKPITRAVSFAAPATIREEYDEEINETLSQGLASASAPALTRPLVINESNEEPTGGLRWFRAMSRTQKLLVLILCLANFSATVFYSCIAPFFPSYAMHKGATETEVGFIFGCFQLVIFLMSPIWGKYMHNVGAKFLFVTGILTTGGAAVLMGFLEYCPPGRSFVIMCFVIRIVDAVGVSAFLTASFTVIASEFPSAISTIFGACETFNGLGYTLGPPIGGFLFQLGGFMLPFVVLGSLVIVVGLVSWVFVPSLEHSSDPNEESPSYRKYLSIPGVWITLLSVFAATVGLGFLDAMYGPHLEEFQISPGLVGAIFLLPSVLYFICAPFLGVIVDRKGRALEFITIGAIISGACYLFMGPAPFLHLQGKLWVLIIANVILGLGTCGQLIPPFGKNLEVTINAGFPDSFETHGMVSGALSSATALGLVFSQPEDGEVRLVGGITEFEGNVQVYHDRRWGYVCDDGWDLRDATVLCRQLGFPRSDFATTASRFGLTHGHIWLSNVQCWGYERNLTSCRSDGWGSGEDCDTSEAAGVICKARLNINGTQPRVRPNRAYVTQSASSQQRRTAARPPVHSTPRSTFRSTMTSTRSATSRPTRPPTTVPTVPPTPMLIADENPIPLSNDIFLLSDRRRPFQLRLAGGRNNREGRVEIKFDGATDWGVLCGNGWTLKETDVVCRQLGLGVGSRAIQNVLFTGPQRSVVLSGVACSGHEKNLMECLHKEVGQADCRGRESIAGVMCSTELPDLVPDMDFLMTSVYLQDQPMFYLTCAMEENCLSSSAYQLDKNARTFPWITRRLLRFTLATKNVGKADFVSFIPKHLWQWHACHKHYHSMEVFAHFDILDDQGRKIAEGHKASFCLEDNACDQPWQKKYNCANFGDQGISVGCFDIYKHDVDCQWIDLTDVKAGVYTFKASVNPDTKVAEMSYDNNVVLCKLYYYDTTAYFDECKLAGHPAHAVGTG